MAQTIEATYRIVTPLFCAGADPSVAELRLPSFKGVLRFWWRALAWSRLRGDLDGIKQQEDTLFGSAGGGQSRVLVRLASVSSTPSNRVAVGSVLTISKTNTGVVGDGARYLGYGVMEAFASAKKNTRSGQLTRACLRAPVEFTVQLRTRDLDREYLDSLKNALIAVGTVGGMGAKSRKGYGALVLRSLKLNGEESWSAPKDAGQLATAIAALHDENATQALPEFTALSKGARHVLLSSDKIEPIELLDLVGRELVRFRSWGRNGKILGGGIDSEKRFKEDHDLMKTSASERKSHPRRIAFGLPHNYGKPSDQQVGPHDSHLDRRASPLFIHVHECGDSPVAVVSFLPSLFLPNGRSDISVGGTQISQVPEDDLYAPIRAFLDRLLDASQRKEPFTNVVEVSR